MKPGKTNPPITAPKTAIKSDPEMRRVTITMPDELCAAIEARAQYDGRTFSNYVQRVLSLHVNGATPVFGKGAA